MKRHLIVATLGALVLLEGLVFGTLVLTVNGASSPPRMIENTGTIGGVIGYNVKAPHEVNVGEHFKITIEVYKQFPGPVYIEYINAYALAGWSWEGSLASNVNLTEGESWHETKNATTTYPLMPSTLGSRVECTLFFSLYNSSLNYHEKDILTFSLSLITEKTGGAGEGYPLNTQILIYALVSTTVLFMATTIYFARKTRVKPGRKTTYHPLFYLRLVFSKILSVLFHFLGFVLSFDPSASWTEADRSMASS